MKQILQDKVFLVSLIVATLCSILLICIITQEETIDAACIAMEQNDDETATKEIEKIWFVDYIGTKKETVLMAACKEGNVVMMEYILEKGADPNEAANGHLTSLELYCRYGYAGGLDGLTLLLNSGALQSKYASCPPVFHLAERFAGMSEEEQKTAAEMVLFLLKQGAPLEYNGTTLLHVAAQNDLSDLFDTLVHTTQGLQLLNTKNKEDLTPWDVAIKYGATGVKSVIRNLEAEYKEEVGETESSSQDIDDMLLNELLESGTVTVNGDVTSNDTNEDEQTITDEDVYANENAEKEIEALEEKTEENVQKGYYQKIYGD